MAIVEQMELVRHRGDIFTDVKTLVEKYRAIFNLELPELDENITDKLILVEIHNSLKQIDKELHG